MYEISKNNTGVYITAKDQTWTKKDCEKLRKEENIYYNKGCFAVRVIERSGSGFLLQIGVEDDGFISFNEHSLRFDEYWADDLIDVMKAALYNRMEIN